MMPATMIPNTKPKFCGGIFVDDRAIAAVRSSDNYATPTKNEECHPTSTVSLNDIGADSYPLRNRGVMIPAPVPENFLCPISFTVMEDPLMTRSGLSFERSAILDWLHKKNECVCPITGEPLLPSMLVPNVPLQSRIRQWKNAPELTKTRGEEAEGEENKKLVMWGHHHQEEGPIQSRGTSLMKEEEDVLSFENDSWCWDADVALSLDSGDKNNKKTPEEYEDSSLRDYSPSDSAPEGAGSTLPRQIAVYNSGDENAANIVAMEPSKLEPSDMPPQQVMRTVTRRVLKAARSA